MFIHRHQQATAAISDDELKRLVSQLLNTDTRNALVLAVRQLEVAGTDASESIAGQSPLVAAVAPILRRIMAGEYLTEEQVAKRLKISKKTLQAARWKGGGPPYCRPLGGGSRAVRYNLLALELWLSQLEFRSTSEATLFDRQHKSKMG